MENRKIVDQIIDHVASHVDLDRIEDLARSLVSFPYLERRERDMKWIAMKP